MSFEAFRTVVNNTSCARHTNKYGTELLYAATCRSCVLAEGLERLLPLHRSFALEPHATMLCILVAGCPACTRCNNMYTYFLFGLN
jgi:hypothetical protein